MDNRTLSPEALSVYRRKAVESVIKHGLSQRKACMIFGFSETSMCKYMREYKENNEQSYEYKKRGARKWSGSKIGEKEVGELIADITGKTPDELGMEYTLWNSGTVKNYIELKYGIKYKKRSIRKIMNKLGFTAQKPIKLAYQRDPKKMDVWLRESYPKIKARAMKEGVRIYWGDEMGIQSEDNRGRTYGIKGQKPEIKKTGSRFKCNVLAAISSQGYMNWTVFDNNFTSDKFIDFIRRLFVQAKQKIFLIVDNHRVHHSKKVAAYVEKHKEKIELFFLPPYYPDMNPQELVNQDVKTNANNFRLLKTIDDLKINVRSYLSKIQFNEFKIRNFFKKDTVAYAALDSNFY